MIPRRIGRYDIDRLLGEGGVGRVYAAHDTLLARQVAIKLLRPEASRNREFIARFLNEAKSFSDLRHPNIAMLYDLDLEGRPPHMVMELVEGHTLGELLEWGALPQQECIAVVAQAAAGLAAAHRKGVIHRDIKPANLMITGSGLLKVMDFGIARVRGSQRLTRTNQVFATLLYASPEQLRGGEVDERTDVYSLGAVAYEMLAGAPPFTADNDAELRTAQLEKPAPPLALIVPGLAPRIEKGIMRALAKQPKERFATVDEFADAIGANAVRRDAADILQKHFTPILRRVGFSQETRLIDKTQRGTVSANKEIILKHRWFAEPGRWFGSPGKATSGSAAPEELPERQPKASLRGPVLALSAVAAAVLFAFGYMFWPNQPPGRLAMVSPPVGQAPEHRVQPGSELTSPAPAAPSPAIYKPPPNPNPVPDIFRPSVVPNPPSTPDPLPRLVQPPQPPAPSPAPPPTSQPTPQPHENAFLGTWSGVWNNRTRLHGRLIVRHIDGRSLEADYYYDFGGKTEFKHLSGSFLRDDTISLIDNEGSKFEFTISGNVLQAKFLSKSGILSGLFNRVGTNDSNLSTTIPPGVRSQSPRPLPAESSAATQRDCFTFNGQQFCN